MRKVNANGCGGEARRKRPLLASTCLALALGCGGTTNGSPDAVPDDRALRLIAPVSTSRSTTHLPTLKWNGAPDVTVSICQDRACTSVIQSFTASGGAAIPPSPLPPGVVFWRVEATTELGNAASATWELKVPPRAAPVDNSWGSFVDVNGDGLSDLVLVDLNQDGAVNGAANGPPRVYVYFGSVSGLPSEASQVLTVPTELLPFALPFPSGVRVRSGDVNGDGYADVVVLGSLFHGGPTGLAATPAWSFSDPTLQVTPPSPNDTMPLAYRVLGQDLGDIDGDGYADLIFAVGARPQCWLGAATAVAPPDFVGSKLYVFRGGPQGISTASTVIDSFAAMTPGCESSLSNWGQGPCAAATINPFVGGIAVADVNADGYADVLTSTLLFERAELFVGSSTGLSSEVAQNLFGQQGDVCRELVRYGMWIGEGDFNGDGYVDMALGQNASLEDSYGKGYLHDGTSAGLAPTAKTYKAQMTGNPTGNLQFGQPEGVRTGDVNGDGYTDLMVGVMPAMSDPTGMELFLGGSGGLATTPAAKLVLNNSVGNSPLIWTSLNEDFNGDGLDDALVNGRMSQNGTLTLFVHAYYATGAGPHLPAQPDWTLSPPAGASAGCCYQ